MRLSPQQKIHYSLRIAIAMCFIGHGAFGIITKPIWCNYFAVFGIGHDLAYRLMPLVGTFDIILGLVMLFYPIRAIAGWLLIWGIATALLRPLSGEPFTEFMERAGNFGAPLAFLTLYGGAVKYIKYWFAKVHSYSAIDAEKYKQVIYLLRAIVFFLFLGHGWLNIIGKASLLNEYTALGFINPSLTAQFIGIFEIIAAFAVLIRPIRSVVFGLLIWKMVSEFFYPHYELFEWIERGGSYGVLLALWFALRRKAAINFKLAI